MVTCKPDLNPKTKLLSATALQVFDAQEMYYRMGVTSIVVFHTAQMSDCGTLSVTTPVGRRSNPSSSANKRNKK